MKYFKKDNTLNQKGIEVIKELYKVNDELLKNPYINEFRWKNEEINIFTNAVNMLQAKLEVLLNYKIYITEIKDFKNDYDFIHKAESNIEYKNKDLLNNLYFCRACDSAFHYIVGNINIQKAFKSMIEEKQF